jgi:ABC-type Na+ transport system ATPase subunit NatA
MSRINVDPSSAMFCASGGGTFKEVHILEGQGNGEKITSLKESCSVYVELSSKDEIIFNAKINPKKLHDDEVRSRIRMMLK